MCYFILYPFMTLNDNTEIVHSEVLSQDNKEQVQVRIEKPVPDGFHSATCWLPDYRWEKIIGFSQEDIQYFGELLESVAHVIIRLAREKLTIEQYTSDGFWNLPENQYRELIDGQLYVMAPPGWLHQEILSALYFEIRSYIAKSKVVYLGPFAVNPDAEDKNWVEPDISVICDCGKLTDKGCVGAPDWIIEIVSPSSRRNDYSRKVPLYLDAGVREYWIVDPARERTTVYYFEEDEAPVMYPFSQPVPVSIYPGLEICIADLLKE